MCDMEKITICDKAADGDPEKNVLDCFRKFQVRWDS